MVNPQYDPLPSKNEKKFRRDHAPRVLPKTTPLAVAPDPVSRVREGTVALISASFLESNWRWFFSESLGPMVAPLKPLEGELLRVLASQIKEKQAIIMIMLEKHTWQWHDG